MLTVFSCVASRNKRAGELSTEPIGDLEPGLAPFSYACGSSNRAGRWIANVLPFPVGLGFIIRAGLKPARPTATSVAGLPWAGVRPARPKGSQKVQPHSAKFILSALLALSFSGSPPAVSATSSVELQSAAGGGGELRGSKSRKSTVYSSSARLVNAVRRQRRAATSSDELQSAAWDGGELRGSKSRKSSAHSPPNSVGFGLSTTGVGRMAQRTGLATLEVARATPLCYEIRPRRASPAPLKRRCARGRRFLSESRYSLSA